MVQVQPAFQGRASGPGCGLWNHRQLRGTTEQHTNIFLRWPFHCLLAFKRNGVFVILPYSLIDELASYAYHLVVSFIESR